MNTQRPIILKKNLLTLLLLMVAISASFCQNITILSGRIIDANTKQAIVNTYIEIPNKGVNTAVIGIVPNSNGAFTLKYPTLLKATGNILITAMGYKSIHRNLSEFIDLKDSLTIELEPVFTKNIEGRNADKTLDYIISRIESNYNNEPYQLNGFYRESILIDSNYVKINEASLKIEKYPFPDKGNLGEVAKLLKGRTFEKAEDNTLWEGLQFENGVALVIRTIETKKPDFLDKSTVKNYLFTLEPSLGEYDNMPVFNISFKPINNKIKGSKTGILQVDTLTMGVLAYQYEFTSEGLKDVMGSMLFGGNKHNKVLSFKVSQTYRAALDNYYLQHSMLEIKASILKDNHESMATLTLTFTPTETNKRLGSPIKDDEMLESTDFPKAGKKYDEIFWANFNFVRATAPMKEIIK